MDLWATLGISPATGIGIAIAGVVAAAGYATLRFRRSQKPRSVGVELGGRG